jgi:hypothetical protein
MRRIILSERHETLAGAPEASENTAATVVPVPQITTTEGLRSAAFGAMTGFAAA